jgi:hypothetical protein
MRREAGAVLGQQLKREMLTKPFFDLNSRTHQIFSPSTYSQATD